jgi:fatty acid desaturase
VGKSDRSDLDTQFERLEKMLPGGMRRLVHWLKGPSSRWVRIPLAILLVAGGFVGFLPILGFWMVPLGLILIAQDIPFLRKPVARLIAWGIDRLERWQRSRGR